MGPWPVLKSCKHNGLIFRSVKIFQSQDWPLRPVSSQEPRATSSSPAWSLPQGRPGPTRSRGHPSGPPTPQPVFPREKMVPLLCPRAAPRLRLCLGPQPRCPTPNASSLTNQAPPDPVTVPRSQGSPAAPATALCSAAGPACNSQQPPGRPQLQPLARRGTDRFLSWVHGGRFPGPRPLPSQVSSTPPAPPAAPRLAGRAALRAALTGLGTCAPAA